MPPTLVARARQEHELLVTVLWALIAAYIGLSLYCAWYGRLNEDEGWYLYAARSVYEGRALYRDFAFFQGPLLPYLYGATQQLFGHSLEVGRLTSCALSLITVGLGMRICVSRGGRLAALVFMAGITLTPVVLWTFTTTRTEPVSAALLMTTAYLLLRQPARPAASAGALVAAVLAAGIRASSAPVIFSTVAWILWLRRPPARQLAIVLLPAAVAAVVLSVPIARDPSAAWFDLFTAQATRHGQLQPAPEWGLATLVRVKAANLIVLQSAYGFVPALSLASTGALLAAAVTRRTMIGVGFAADGIGLAALGLTAYLPNLVPRAVFPEYFVPAFPLFLALVATAIGTLFRGAAAAGRRLILGAAAGLIALQALTFIAQFNLYTNREDPDLQELRTVADYLRTVVPPDRTLATMDTYLAVASGLRVLPGWEMSLFSYHPLLPEAEGQRFNLLTNDRLADSLRDPSVGAVVLSDMALGILVKRQWGMGFRPSATLTEQELQPLLPGLARFRLARVFEHFGQFNDNLYVLLRD